MSWTQNVKWFEEHKTIPQKTLPMPQVESDNKTKVKEMKSSSQPECMPCGGPDKWNSEPARSGRKSWRTHTEWHDHLCCDESEHPPTNRTIWAVVPEMWQKTLHMTMRPRWISPQVLQEMARKTEDDPVGGALFRHPEFWMRLMPGTRAARWQKLGGVDWRVRKTKQQPAVAAKWHQDKCEMEEISAQMQELMSMGVYVDVPETEAQEEAARARVRSGEWEERQKRSRSSMRSGKQQTVSRCKYYNGVRERWESEVEVSEMESIPSAQMRLQKAQERRK
jgi:hypothetical protein